MGEFQTRRKEMVTYEYTGVVEEVGETKEFANNFTKRELVVGNDVDSTNRFPNPVPFSFKKDRCSLLDGINKGDRVKVSFTIDGRRWEGPNGVKYFTDLTAWKIETIKDGGQTVEAVPAAPAAPEPVAEDPAATNSDDLPF